MSCKTSMLKSSLGALNVALALLGIVIIGLSIYELNNTTAGTAAFIAIVIQIFVGSFVILTSFLGCIGSCRESLGLTWSYVTCIAILLAFQIYIIIAAYTTNKVEDAVNAFNDLWLNYPKNALPIGQLEQKLNCCGKFSAQDYILRGTSIPKSCYTNFDRIAEHLFTEGCLAAVQINEKAKCGAGLIIKWILFLAEISSIIFAAFLAITIRNKQRRAQFGK